MKLNLFVGVLMTVFGPTVPAVVNAGVVDRAEVAGGDTTSSPISRNRRP